MAVKVALLGFGTVGTGVYETIHSQKEKWKEVIGEDIEIAAVLVKDKNKERTVDTKVRFTTDFQEILSLPGLDAVVEAIVGREPALTYNTALLEKGIHVVSANKECIAYNGGLLKETAKRNGVTFSYEASVGGGIPIIRTIHELLRINPIEKLEGILNGTCNFILSDMRSDGVSFEGALAAAQHYGYAEADPTNDIEGWDAFYKINILSELVFGEQPDWNNVERKGISDVSPEDIQSASAAGKRLKLIASAENTKEGVTASVKPVALGPESPLYSVEGVNNAVHIRAGIAGNLLLQGAGAGAEPTASAIIEDLAHVFSGKFIHSLLTVH
ncbi:MAG TPA: homoserine dehydrogenase [Bacillales bacterium]|nr:homoserine dehydrogenase [Bacillales bacterium]